MVPHLILLAEGPQSRPWSATARAIANLVRRKQRRRVSQAAEQILTSGRREGHTLHSHVLFCQRPRPFPPREVSSLHLVIMFSPHRRPEVLPLHHNRPERHASVSQNSFPRAQGVGGVRIPPRLGRRAAQRRRCRPPPETSSLRPQSEDAKRTNSSAAKHPSPDLVEVVGRPLAPGKEGHRLVLAIFFWPFFRAQNGLSQRKRSCTYCCCNQQARCAEIRKCILRKQDSRFFC